MNPIENFTDQVAEALKDTADKLKRIKFITFILHFFSTVEFILGVVQECVLKIHDIAAASGLDYDTVKGVVVDWINSKINIPGPNEAEEKQLFGYLFDLSVSWFERQFGIKWGQIMPRANLDESDPARSAEAREQVAMLNCVPYRKWKEIKALEA